MKTTIYNIQGTKTGDIDLPEEIFGLEMNDALVHQVYTSLMSNKRVAIAHTKDRSEVRGGGKKPWKQKGTGRARHGSIRSPIWIGGGITFGPRNDRNFKKKINKKMKAKALFIVLSQKMRDGEIIFADTIAFDAPKTAHAKAAIAALAKSSGSDDLTTKRKNAAFVAVSEADTNVVRSFANIGNMEVNEMRKLNIGDLLKYKYLVVTHPEEFVAHLQAKLSASEVTA
jgi:large subunit ribosomal protein L4